MALRSFVLWRCEKMADTTSPAKKRGLEGEKTEGVVKKAAVASPSAKKDDNNSTQSNAKVVEEIDDAIRAVHAAEYETKDGDKSKEAEKEKEKEGQESYVGMSQHKEAFSHDKKEEVTPFFLRLSVTKHSFYTRPFC